jgi:ribonuclease P protein component
VSLPKPYRLRRRQDFQRVYQQGKRDRGKYLMLRSWRQFPDRQIENLPATRFGISVSQKVSKKAVVRNLLKRRVKAALRQLLPEIEPGWWVVVIVQASATTCEYDEILRELKQLLVAAEVINGHS